MLNIHVLCVMLKLASQWGRVQCDSDAWGSCMLWRAVYLYTAEDAGGDRGLLHFNLFLL